MPLFGGAKRPALDGLTKEEESRRDALNPEVLRRTGEKGVSGQSAAALSLLKEKVESEPAESLWPLLLGWQYMSMRRYAPAIKVLSAGIERNSAEVRPFYAIGNAYFQAGETRLNQGPAATEDVVPAAMTADNLYQEALRYFRKGMELTPDKDERDLFKSALSIVEKAVARKAGRL